MLHLFYLGFGFEGFYSRFLAIHSINDISYDGHACVLMGLLKEQCKCVFQVLPCFPNVHHFHLGNL